ncbi:hypothetical protein ACET3Z_009167 [Daucus carota]
MQRDDASTALVHNSFASISTTNQIPGTRSTGLQLLLLSSKMDHILRKSRNAKETAKKWEAIKKTKVKGRKPESIKSLANKAKKVVA